MHQDDGAQAALGDPAEGKNLAKVKSALRVFQILELFAAERQPLAAVQVSRGLGIPGSSTFFLLKSMVTAGYLTLDAQTRRYFPSPRLPLLASQFDDRRFSGTYLREAMSQLQNEIGETVVLACQNELDMQLLLAFSKRAETMHAMRPGRRAPMWNCSTGWAVLLAKPDREIDRLARKAAAAGQASGDAVLPDQFRRILRAAETRDGVIQFHEPRRPALSIACQIPALRVGRPLALAVTGPAAAMEEKRMAVIEKLASIRTLTINRASL